MQLKQKFNLKMHILIHKHFRSVIILLVIVNSFACKLWTIRPIGWKENKPTATTQTFNAESYVNSIWDSKIVPLVNEKAVDLTTVLNALDANVDEAKKQFGLRYDEGATHFIVKGNAVVLDSDERLPQRTITIIPTNYKGKTKIIIQAGNVYRGTALRDAVGFIKFNDYSNQLQFAEVSTKLHEYVTYKVIQERFHVHEGAKVSFYAVFTLNDPAKILLTPVKLELLGGGKF